MQIEIYAVGPIRANCYFLIHEETKEIVVFDPGGNGKDLIRIIEENEYKPQAVILTHCHFDHAHDAEMIAGEYHIPICIHEADAEALEDASLNASEAFGMPEVYRADRSLRDGEIITFAGFSLQTIWTPGHTKGGACFYLKEENLLFTGDTLFAGGIGRTDLPGGSGAALDRSIREKILTLPEETAVLPGHGDYSNIKTEKRYF